MNQFAQTIEGLLSNPQVLHATIAGVLGVGVGWLLRLIFRLVMIYLASVTLLLVVLQWVGILHVEFNLANIEKLLAAVADLLKTLPWPDPLFFTGGIVSGYKFGLFRR
jgi:uncharacterized membrane protein (Fun14 family)